MARSRNIKPGLFKNEILGQADPLYTLLFEGLWVLADREGRLEDRPLRIKAEVFPYRDGLNVAAMLDWLQAERFIQRYEVAGKRYIVVCEFVKHQNPHKNEGPSLLPPPPLESASQAVPIFSEVVPSPSEALALIPSTLIPDSRDSAATASPPSVDKSEPKKPQPVAVDELVAAGIDEGTAAEFIAHKANLKAPLTARAWADHLAESRKAGWTPKQAAEKVMAKGWKGFEAKYVANEGPLFATPPPTVTHNPDLDRTAALLQAQEQRAADAVRPKADLLARLNAIKANA